jgi:tripartite-type tricarboxylate transporter receptor subunit TctC
MKRGNFVGQNKILLKEDVMKRGNLLKILFVCLVTVCLSVQASAEEQYPNKPINIIVPYSAGGGTDIGARIYADYISRKWNVPVNVVNKPGGGTIPATFEAISAKPDAYTLFAITGGVVYTDVFLSEKIPYKWDDFTFLGQLTVDPGCYIVRPDAPWKSLKELAEFIRNNPGKLSWGGSGKSGAGYVNEALFCYVNKIPIEYVNHVSFKGGAPTIAALAGSHIDAGCQHMSEVASMIAGKKIRGLAVIWDERLPAVPNVPTTTEAGYPELDIVSRYGLSGPPGIPKNIVDKWVKLMEEMSKDPTFISKVKKTHKMVSYRGPEDFKKSLQSLHSKVSTIAGK